jgi:hypothetical protein
VRLPLIVGFAAVCASLAPATASARQQPDADRGAARAAAQARLDSLIPVMMAAGRRANDFNQSQRDAEQALVVAGTDTIRVGPLRVIVPAGDGERARPYFEKAWAYYSPMLDGVAPAELEEQLFAFQNGPVLKPLATSPRVMRVEARPWSRRANVEEEVRSLVGRAMNRSLPMEQAAWIDPALITKTPNLVDTYRELVTGMSATLDLCLAGNLESCWSALGVTPSMDPVEDIHAWYTEGQIERALHLWPGYSGGRRGCLDGQLLNCENTLKIMRTQVTPLGPASRAALASTAIELGGEGAYHRFAEPIAPPIRPSERAGIESARALADDSFQRVAQPLVDPVDLREVIGRTAGMDPDLVLAEWRRRVIAARPDGPGADSGVRYATVLWILFFTAFSTRSTRWRLG